MFDFQKEVIINSADQFCLVTEKMLNSTSETDNPVYLHVNRCMDYYPEYITGEEVEVTTGHKTNESSNHLTIADYIFSTSEHVPGGIYKLIMDVHTIKRCEGDFVSPWSDTKKIVVEYENFRGKFKDDYDVVRATEASINKVLPNYLSASYDEGNFEIRPKLGSGIRIRSGKLFLIDPDNGEETLMQTMTKSNGRIQEYDKGEFATGDWLIENLRFPTGAATGYYALAADERPIPGEIYTQFTFQYAVPRRGLSGMNAVGQRMMSVTTHTFYVKGYTDNSSDPAGLFKQALSALQGQSASPTSADIEGPAAYNPEEEMPAYTPEEGNENPTVSEE